MTRGQYISACYSTDIFVELFFRGRWGSVPSSCGFGDLEGSFILGDINNKVGALRIPRVWPSEQPQALLLSRFEKVI